MGGRAVLGAAADQASRDEALVWLLDGCLGDAVFSDADLAEEDLVEDASPEVARVQVGFERLLGEHEGVLQRCVDVFELDLRAAQQIVERGFLGFDAFGRAAHDVLGHAALEMQLKELGLLVLKGLQAAVVADGGSLDHGDVLLRDRLDGCAYLRDLFTRELQRPVERRDLVLYPVDGVVA